MSFSKGPTCNLETQELWGQRHSGSSEPHCGVQCGTAPSPWGAHGYPVTPVSSVKTRRPANKDPNLGEGAADHCPRTASLMHRWQRSRVESGLECMWGSPWLQFVGTPSECCAFQSTEVLFTSCVRSESLPAGLCYCGVQPWHLRLQEFNISPPEVVTGPPTTDTLSPFQ